MPNVADDHIPNPRSVRRLHHDQRGMVTAYLMRFIIPLVILIAAVEEVGQVVMAQVDASNAAGASAQAGADDWAAHKNVNKAEVAAIAELKANDPQAQMLGFQVGNDGTVTVQVSERAHTFLIQHLPYLKTFQVQKATESEIHSLASTH